MAKPITVTELTEVVVCLLLKGMIFIIIALYKRSAFLVFRREQISEGLHVKYVDIVIVEVKIWDARMS